MSKKALLPQTRRHILVYDEDWEYLLKNFGPGSHGFGLGVSGAIRQIVHQRVQGLKARENGELDKLATQSANQDKELGA